MALRVGQLDERFDAIFGAADVRQYEMSFDYETFCELDLKQVGLDRYVRHPSFRVLMVAYSIDGGPVKHHDFTENEEMPADFERALLDDNCQLWAYNAQFERVVTDYAFSIVPKLFRWRCSMVLGYMQSFVGGLDQMAQQTGMPANFQKDARGSKLISYFCMPRKPTLAKPWRIADSANSWPDWQDFCEYNKQDVVAEMALKRRLIKYHVPELEWKLYAIDQEINDRGIPIDRRFVENAIIMSNRRKAELKAEMIALTGLQNPNSIDQLLPWLQDEGYWFDDLGKKTVEKVLAENEFDEEKKGYLTELCVEVLKLRQQAARASVRKYDAIIKAIGPDDRLRYCLQFAGASRTNRWAGRRFQPQNLPGTPGVFEDNVWLLNEVVQAIRDGDYDLLCLYFKEPLDALSGLVRSAIRAPRGSEFQVCDLSSIESVVLGYAARCERILNVFREGRDAYKDFATELYKVAYEEVTKDQRKKAKPATLGAGYRLGGGELYEGKKTGLWGYAENMGIKLTKKESWDSVKIYRETYHEVVTYWKDLEYAIGKTVKTHVPTKVGCVKFKYEKPYLVAQLPSGRNIYYYKPMVRPVKVNWTNPETGEKKTYIKDEISYMGKTQNGNAWTRIKSHGGKFCENIVQAIARDILCVGMVRAWEAGFALCLHVHDELVALTKKGSNLLSYDTLRECMKAPISWAKDLPLGAAGFTGELYRKD